LTYDIRAFTSVFGGRSFKSEENVRSNDLSFVTGVGCEYLRMPVR
jgi:hypothetical protein